MAFRASGTSEEKESCLFTKVASTQIAKGTLNDKIMLGKVHPCLFLCTSAPLYVGLVHFHYWAL